MATKAKLETVEDRLAEIDEQHSTLAGAMCLAFAEIEAATRSADNPAFKRDGKALKYADLTAIIEAVKPPLIKHGLFFTQRCHPDPDGVSVETVLHHNKGGEMSLGTLYVPANKRDAQGFGSALTYARRYALQTAFGVPTEDDDGNAATKTMDAGLITQKQFEELEALRAMAGVSETRFCKRYEITVMAQLPADKFGDAKAALTNLIKEPA